MKNKVMSIFLICALLAGLVSLFGVGASAETGDVLTKLKSDSWFLLFPDEPGGARSLEFLANNKLTYYFSDCDGDSYTTSCTYKKVDKNTVTFTYYDVQYTIKNSNSNNLLAVTIYNPDYNYSGCGVLIKNSLVNMGSTKCKNSFNNTRWLSNTFTSLNSDSYVDITADRNKNLKAKIAKVYTNSTFDFYEYTDNIIVGQDYHNSGSKPNIIALEMTDSNHLNAIIFDYNNKMTLDKWSKMFPDIAPGAWYYNAVNYVNNKGYITGYENGRFGVTDSLKRQDFVVILARIAKADLSQYKNMTPKNSDVKKSAYYAAAVNWATSNNIVSGYANGRFGVNDPITREQICTILYKYKNSPSVSSIENIYNFDDWYNISSFAEIPVAWAIQKGVISGTQDGRIAPTKTASRAEIATIIMNMDKKGMFK